MLRDGDITDFAQFVDAMRQAIPDLTDDIQEDAKRDLEILFRILKHIREQ